MTTTTTTTTAAMGTKIVFDKIIPKKLKVVPPRKGMGTYNYFVVLSGSRENEVSASSSRASTPTPSRPEHDDDAGNGDYGRKAKKQINLIGAIPPKSIKVSPLKCVHPTRPEPEC